MIQKKDLEESNFESYSIHMSERMESLQYFKFNRVIAELSIFKSCRISALFIIIKERFNSIH